MFIFWYVSLIGTLIIIIIIIIIIITTMLGYQKWSKLCIDVPRTFWARNPSLLKKLCFDIIRRLFLYVFLTMSNTCKEILLSDNNLTSLGKLRLKSKRIKTTSPPSFDKHFVEPKRYLVDNLEWFNTQHKKEKLKKKKKIRATWIP